MSQAIHNPTLAQIDEHSATSATFVVEPLHTGYGMTLGNSLRRVLLSSIRGAAMSAFRVEGISHEFTTIPGVVEDVVDIMLNVKSIRLKSDSDSPVELSLTKKGSGTVTAGDIKLTADVEIVNPEQVICTIDDPKGSVTMHFVVESGRGYRTLEESSEARIHSDMIALDAFFSPVQRVRYKVENTRVGQNTDLDKLLLTIDTDGTITPTDAFEEAAAILVNQYTALAGSTRVEAGPSLAVSSDENASHLMMSIEEMNLSARTTNALINNDIRIINDLVTLSETDLRELKGFGSKALDEVKDALAGMEF
ncbi:DNA-directed RNA polymerase subunit alpha [Candidatus Saccharibacteria bacterium]|nr:DNA-directed RNA polymerase subunit alpha [Candidatus Saccharibacteria bacterium]NCU40613.1 DNA-directed RNA polymerase subunit alpha [Candidatus Saccharibacteria bacterium]